jgi:hypothetical protein
MAAPEVAEYVGKRLTQYGNTIPVEAQLARGGAATGAIRQTRAPGTVVSSVPPTAAAGPRAQAEIARELGKALDDIETPAQAGLKDLDKAIEAEKKRAGAIRMSARKTEAAARKAEEAADLSEATKPSGYTAQEQDLLRRATSNRPASAAARSTVTEPMPIGDEIDLTAVSGGAPNVARERAAERFGRNFVDEGATTPTGRGLPQELLDQAEELPEPPPSLDIPASRSRRSPLSSVDDRLTENDFDTLRQIVAENPGISTSEASQLLLEERAARSRMYRTRAGMDRGAQDAFDLDE